MEETTHFRSGTPERIEESGSGEESGSSSDGVKTTSNLLPSNPHLAEALIAGKKIPSVSLLTNPCGAQSPFSTQLLTPLPELPESSGKLGLPYLREFALKTTSSKTGDDDASLPVRSSSLPPTVTGEETDAATAAAVAAAAAEAAFESPNAKNSQGLKVTRVFDSPDKHRFRFPSQSPDRRSRDTRQQATETVFNDVIATTINSQQKTIELEAEISGLRTELSGLRSKFQEYHGGEKIETDKRESRERKIGRRKGETNFRRESESLDREREEETFRMQNKDRLDSQNQRKAGTNEDEESCRRRGVDVRSASASPSSSPERRQHPTAATSGLPKYQPTASTASSCQQPVSIDEQLHHQQSSSSSGRPSAASDERLQHPAVVRPKTAHPRRRSPNQDPFSHRNDRGRYSVNRPLRREGDDFYRFNRRSNLQPYGPGSFDHRAVRPDKGSPFNSDIDDVDDDDLEDGGERGELAFHRLDDGDYDVDCFLDDDDNDADGRSRRHTPSRRSFNDHRQGDDATSHRVDGDFLPSYGDGQGATSLCYSDDDGTDPFDAASVSQWERDYDDRDSNISLHPQWMHQSAQHGRPYGFRGEQTEGPDGDATLYPDGIHQTARRCIRFNETDFYDDGSRKQRQDEEIEDQRTERQRERFERLDREDEDGTHARKYGGNRPRSTSRDSGASHEDKYDSFRPSRITTRQTRVRDADGRSQTTTPNSNISRMSTSQFAAIAAKARQPAAAANRGNSSSSSRQSGAGGNPGGGGGSQNNPSNDGAGQQSPGSSREGSRESVVSNTDGTGSHGNYGAKVIWPTFEESENIRNFNLNFVNTALLSKFPRQLWKSQYTNLLKGMASRLAYVYNSQNPGSTFRNLREHLEQKLAQEFDTVAKSRFRNYRRMQNQTLTEFASQLQVLCFEAYGSGGDPYSTAQMEEKVLEVFCQNLQGRLGYEIKLRTCQSVS